MSAYVRPQIDAPVLRDSTGEVIEYGNRWDGAPPNDAYSVDAHPERFAPLHTIATALIEHLTKTYDVEVVAEFDTLTDVLHVSPQDVIRSVRLQPNDAKCAPLTFVFTIYPGVLVHAGLLHDFHYPRCGCNACDSHWQDVAEELELLVFAVAAGNYREYVRTGLRLQVGHSLTYPDGSASGGSGSQGFPPDRIKAAKKVLRNLPTGWSPWPTL